MKLPRLLSALVVVFGFAVAACGGGGGNYKVPVDSPLMVFTPPEASELTGEGAGDDVDLTKPAPDEPPPAPEPKPEPKPEPPKPAPKPAGGKPQ